MQYIHVQDSYHFIAIIFLILLSLLCWMVYRNVSLFIRFEEKTTEFFQRQFGNPQMGYADGLINSVLTFLATYGSPTFVSIFTVFIGLIFFIKVDRMLAVWLLGVVSTGGIFGIFLKNIFRRERPSEHLAFDTGYSFPSGHAIASTLFFLSILLVFLPIVPSLVIRIILMGLIYLVWGSILFSRMYFHAHHIGDLLAGVSLGIFWVLASMSVYNLVVKMIEQYILHR